MFVSHKRLPGPNQRRAMFERRRNFGEIGNGLEQRVKVYEHAAHKTIREVAGKLRIFVDECAKTERVIVKRVDQTPH